ncbi:hypothetical protein [Caldithrix abyssi]|uniref:hypothetical protein n=1 Tax=Caldithrix abyssi TaxID=187145 RepID=UPI0005C5BCCF|nr:hypothetical protein [Caldithrix abyssi]
MADVLIFTIPPGEVVNEKHMHFAESYLTYFKFRHYIKNIKIILNMMSLFSKAAEPQPKTNHQERKEATKRTKIFSRKPFCQALVEKGTPVSKRKNRTVSHHVRGKLSKSAQFTPEGVSKATSNVYICKK